MQGGAWRARIQWPSSAVRAFGLRFAPANDEAHTRRKLVKKMMTSDVRQNSSEPSAESWTLLFESLTKFTNDFLGGSRRQPSPEARRFAKGGKQKTSTRRAARVR